MLPPTPNDRLYALAALVPRFSLSVGCADDRAGTVEAVARVHGAAFTPLVCDIALPQGTMFDCMLIGESAESRLQDEGYLADIGRFLASTGMIIALLPASYGEAMSSDLEGALERAGFFLLRTFPIDAEYAGFCFARETYDPVQHARTLAEANLPGRAAAVLEWIEHYAPLEPRQRATIAVEKLGFFRQAVERANGAPNDMLLFHAQKEFHIAVHEWPRNAGPYLDQAAIWRRFDNHDYAARLLRSLQRVAPNPVIADAIVECRPETTTQPPIEGAPEWTGKVRPRVLVLSHDSSDYGMDTLYDGLCQVLGGENVVEYPWKPTLHGRDKDAAVSYPCWFDYPGEARRLDDLVCELRDGRFDLIVFADFVQQKNRADVHRLVGAAPDVPVVAYDSWDDGSATQDSAREYLGGRTIAAYFKREMLACLDYGGNAYPLPFGYPDRHVPRQLPDRRTTDLFWAGKRLFGTRSLYLDYLRDVLGRSLDQKLTQEQYRRAISQARIGLSFFGFGFDTVRYWELAAHGCMVLAERPPIRIPHNFVEGESAVFFDDLPELEEKLAYYFAHGDEAERIGRAGRELFMRHHTSSARARQFLGRIEEVLK